MPKKVHSKVGIVILTYNSEKYISNCLESILHNEYKAFTCVVVDNNSTDDTVSIVHNKYPYIKLLKNKANNGYAAGNNHGIRYLLKIKNISYILILNPDTLIDKNLLNKLVKFMEDTPSAGVTGPIITYMHTRNKIWFAGGKLNRLFGYTKHAYMDTYLPFPKRHPFKMDFITGACMMVRVDVLKRTGLLPIDYFMYYEDVDFCQKVYKFGYSCYVIPNPLVRHYVSASAGKKGTNDLSPLRAYYYARNPFIYIKNNVKGFYKITNIIGQFIIRLPYYTFQMAMTGNFRSIISYLKGMKDGMQFKF